MMPVNLLVVRHGESIGNEAKRKSEKGDNSLIERLKGTHTAHWPLTRKGTSQAKLAGDFINDKIINDQGIFFDRMYVSCYARAMQTASGLDIVRASWILDVRITERNWGDLDCLTDEERYEKFAENIKMRKVEPLFWKPVGGESFLDLIIRIRDFIDSLFRSNAENVIVVCHGEVMKAIRIILCQLTPTEYAKMEFSKDPLERIHNCQIDHYTRRGPDLVLQPRISWLQVYRPSEGRNKEVAIPWRELQRRRFSSQDLSSMAGKLSNSFNDIID